MEVAEDMQSSHMTSRTGLRRVEALAKAQKLLRPDEESLPSEVVTTIDFFLNHETWFKLSRNPAVTSCRDAAMRRWRLGYRGIALADELRSYLTETEVDGVRTYILFHCRGDSRFDFDKIGVIPKLYGMHLRKADVRELSEGSIGYGLINPFVAPKVLGKTSANVIQVFDQAVLDGSGETKSMMTNAGDLTWAVEFDPIELIRDRYPAIGIVAPIATSSERHQESVAPIGILTGNAPESGALLWRKINKAYRTRRAETFRGDVSYPRIIVHSLPAMGWSMELDDRDRILKRVIETEVTAISNSGARSIAFACNTTQYYGSVISETLAGRGARFVSLATAVERWLLQRPNQRFLLAGIGYVTNRHGWSAFERVLSLPNVRPPNDRQSAQINDLAYDVKQGVSLAKTYQKFRAMIRSAGEPNVLLLLTELSMIFDHFPREKISATSVFDAMDVYAEAILDDACTLG